jgi:hypothetical protein
MVLHSNLFGGRGVKQAWNHGILIVNNCKTKRKEFDTGVYYNALFSCKKTMQMRVKK